MKRFIILIAITTLVFSVFSGCGSDKREGGVTGEKQYTGIDGGYVGSAACSDCHPTIKVDFDQSGHPYKYRHTGGANPPTDPLTALFPRPNASATDWINTSSLNSLIVSDNGILSWTAVNYALGGWGWKIRWGVRDTINAIESTKTGYIWAGSKTQYNIENDSWSAYSSGSDKKYECAICHNTNGIVFTSGYSCYTAPGSRTQPWANNPGMSSSNQGGYYSEWTFDGVQCEECHGPGLNHANSPSKDNITKNTSKDLCGKCHIRSTNTSGQDGECGGTGAILTNGAVISGDWISHHEQYNELVGLNNDGVHSSLDCTECHDPHKRSKKVLASVASALGITDNDKSAEERGAIKKTCEDCHLNVSSADTAATDSMRIAHKNNNVTCVDCHMAEATKSAINYSTSGWGRKADLKTHIFKIKPSGSGITRTNADGKNIATNYITPKYTCGKCHDSNIYGSVISGPTSESDAQSSADNYHGLQ